MSVSEANAAISDLDSAYGSDSGEQKEDVDSSMHSFDDSGEENEDWYNSSDTSDDIPDPDLRAESLYQDEDSLPKRLKKSHFKEGLIYTMTLSAKRNNPMLVQIIELKKDSFVYQCFFNQTSSAQTWHESGKDKTCSYADVWRLAPRRELVRPCSPGKIFVGQTLRFTYGMTTSHTTITVKSFGVKVVKGEIVCGPRRGDEGVYEIYEMLDCTEVFGSTLLHNLLTQVKDAK